MAMSRETVSAATLRHILIAEIGKMLDVDAQHLRGKITIVYVSGHPNWDATIDMVGLTTAKAFSRTVEDAKGRYDIDKLS
jgi:hypothetical protein